MILSTAAQRYLEIQNLASNLLEFLKVWLIQTDLTNEEMLDYNVLNTPGNQATFTGYGPKSNVAMHTESIGPDGELRVLSPLESFRDTGDAVPNTIYGYAVLNLTPDTVIFAEKFAATYEMLMAEQRINLVLVFNYPAPTGGAILI